MTEPDLNERIANLENRVKELETEKLINLYAYSNLERAILTTIITEKVMAESNRQVALQQYYGTAREHLYNAEFPKNDPNSPDIKLASLKLAADLFRDVESRLLRAGIISERLLKVLD